MSPRAAFVIAVGVSTINIAVIAGLTLLSAPATVQAAIFPGGGEQGLISVAAHGRIVDSWLGGAVIVAAPDSSDFADLVRTAGALAVIPLPRSAGCTPPAQKP